MSNIEKERCGRGCVTWVEMANVMGNRHSKRPLYVYSGKSSSARKSNVVHRFKARSNCS